MGKLFRVKSLLSIGFADTLGAGIAAIFWFYIATLLEPEQYGEIFYFLGIAGIISYLALIGTQQTITVYTAKNVKIHSTLYFLSLVCGIIASIVIIVVFYRIDVGLVILGYIINTLVIGELLGRKIYNSYTKYVLAQKILTLVLGIGFYYLFGVNGIIYALALTYVMYAVRIYKSFRDSKIDFSLLKHHKDFIINNYMVTLSSGIYGQIDKLIIAPLLGFALLGNYVLALQVIGILMIFPGIIFKYILPQDATGIPNKKLKKLVMCGSIIIAIISIIFSPIIIQELFPRYKDVVNAVQIMSVNVVPATLNMLYTSKFLSLEKSKFVLVSRLISLLVIFVGMLVLGPMFGIIGLAAAFVMSSTIAVVFLILANRGDSIVQQR